MQLKKNIAISDTGFLFDPTTGDSFTLNPMGVEILKMIREGKSQDEITAHITSIYDVVESAFERYFYDFTTMLKHHQIIEGNGEA